MGRNSTAQPKGLGRFRRAAEAVKRLFAGRRGEQEPAHPLAAPPPPARKRNAAPTSSRTTRRETDIPMDVLENAYTPQDTSSKAGFRSDGADHQRDQEFARGAADDRWNDEDHLTNKSGDPRIGTHRRTYEPNESRAESRE